jgi:hypothetical protein
MPCHSLPSVRHAVLLIALASAGPAIAQRDLPSGTVVSGGVSAYHQFDTDRDGGGDFNVTGALGSIDVLHPFSPQLRVGLSLRYDYENWDFSGGSQTFARGPWDDVNRVGTGIPFLYTPSPDWLVAFVPTAQWAFESGASTGDALIAGATLFAAKTFSPDLTLGLGVGAFDELEETRAFPFVVVRWQINERLLLANPFRAGPAGGAGLELSYRADDAWEFAAGGTWRSYRFRLDRDGPYPGGIGESRSVPLFARASWAPTKDTRVDFHAGVLVGGKLKVMDRDGNDIASEGYDAAPMVGITWRTRL